MGLVMSLVMGFGNEVGHGVMVPAAPSSPCPYPLHYGKVVALVKKQ